MKIQIIGSLLDFTWRAFVAHGPRTDSTMMAPVGQL